jgi:hypothetical protein
MTSTSFSTPVEDLVRHTPETLADDLLVGAREIGAFIGRSPGAAHKLLASGVIPGGKIGYLWVGSKRALRGYFAEVTAGRGRHDGQP